MIRAVVRYGSELVRAVPVLNIKETGAVLYSVVADLVRTVLICLGKRTVLIHAYRTLFRRVRYGKYGTLIRAVPVLNIEETLAVRTGRPVPQALLP